MLQLYVEEDVFSSKNNPSIVWLLVLMHSIITIVMLLGFLYLSLRSMLELTNLFRRAINLVGELLQESLHGLYAVMPEVWRASCWTVSEALRLLFVLIVELRCEVCVLFTILQDAWIEIWSELTRENLITVPALSIMVYALPILLDAVKDILKEKRHSSI
jgi:hypothetical protein